jgi:hypothetical protein
LARGLAVRPAEERANPTEVFGEAIEYYRRAMAERSPGELDLAIEVVVGAFTEAARAWKAFGQPYDGRQVMEGLEIADDGVMYQDLGELVGEVFADGNSRFIRSLRQLADRLAKAGFEEDAPMLFGQGAEVSYALARSLPSGRDDAVVAVATAQVAVTTIDSLGSLSRRLEDPGELLERRLRAARFLAHTLESTGTILKCLLDAEQDEAVAMGVRNLTWAEGRWDPLRGTRDLELTDDLAGALETIERQRALTTIQLGAWVVREVFDGEPSSRRDALLKLLPALDEAAGKSGPALNLVASMFERPIGFGLLHRWEGDWMSERGTGAWTTRVDDFLCYWLVLLLLRRSEPATSLELESVAHPAMLRDRLRPQLGAVVGDADIWGDFLTADEAADLNGRADALGRHLDDAAAGG